MILFKLILASMCAAYSTYWLTHVKKMNIVRSASLVSLIFVGAAFFFPALTPLQTTFYGGAFVGMSEPSRLNRKYVLWASVFFAIIFYLLQVINFVHYRGGMGGTLGATAFVACLFTYCLQIAVRKLPFKGLQNRNRSL